MNDKNLRKNNSQNCNLLIKPEKVVNNFMLQRTIDINISSSFSLILIIILHLLSSAKINNQKTLACILKTIMHYFKN